MEYKTFEDLEVYKIAREFRKKMYKLSKELPDYEKYNLANQMRRAALSLTNCIAEGHGRFHYQENIQNVKLVLNKLPFNQLPFNQLPKGELG